MRSIGVRELRQQASRYLRDVQAGETIEVTDRGRPVARLVPVPQGTTVEELAASGRLTLGVGDALDIGAPLEPAAGKPPASEILSKIRADER
jgi:prevent-host-death family protein